MKIKKKISNAGIIQCTQCSFIQNPFCEYDIKCNGCNNNLTHPISAKIIQCPLCLTFMDVSDPNLSSMDLVEITQDISIKRKCLKRKLNDIDIDIEKDKDKDNKINCDLSSNSNTTVTNQSIPKYGVSKKRRKIFDINDYNEQWIDYQSDKIFQFQPNRPNNNISISHHLQQNGKKIEMNECESNHKLLSSQLDKNKEKLKNVNNVNSKYGSFKMTSLTFI